MITAVFDTNVYFQAAIGKGGPAHEYWLLVVNKAVQVYVSQEILTEVADVLSRPKTLKQFSSLTSANVNALLKRYRMHATLIDNVNEVFKLHRDPADEKFINLAIKMDVHYLVTRDKDLLDLSKDSQFSLKFPRLKIVSPVGFLEIVRMT